MLIQKLIYSYIDLVFSATCPICNIYAAKYPMPICQNCEDSLTKTSTPQIISSHYIPQIITCSNYTNLTKKCIKQFKYSRQKHIIYAFSKIIEGLSLQEMFREEKIDLLVPVPIHKTKLAVRGFNQSEIITQTLSTMLKIPVSFRDLIKIKNTTPQSTLNKKERMRNLKGSFFVKNPGILAGKTIMLVDDVITTGATLDTCAKELFHVKVKKIIGFTLARTP